MRWLVVADGEAWSSPCDMAHPRLCQLLAILEDAGIETDLVLRRNGSAPVPRALERPASRVAWADDLPLAELLRPGSGLDTLAPREGWPIVVLAGRAAREPVGQSRSALLRDHAGHPVPEQIAEAARTHHLAMSDVLLGRSLELGTGLRLPYRPPSRGVPRDGSERRSESPRIGWAGAGGARMAEGWSALLSELASRAGSWPGGVLLAGAWASRVEVPRTMCDVMVRPDLAPSIAMRTLDLAVLAGDVAEGAEVHVACALRRHLPVLACEAAAARFGNRWRFATASTPQSLSERLLDHGHAAATPDGMTTAEVSAEAEAEMDRDAAAMEAYVIARALDLADAE